MTNDESECKCTLLCSNAYIEPRTDFGRAGDIQKIITYNTNNKTKSRRKARYLLGCCTYSLGCRTQLLGCSSQLSGCNWLLTAFPGASVTDGASDLFYEHISENSGHTCEAMHPPLFGEEPAETGGAWDKFSSGSAEFSYQPQIWSSVYR